jgi:hypothetical protein
MMAKTGNPLPRAFSQSRYDAHTSWSIRYALKVATVLTAFELIIHRKAVAPAGGISNATGSSAHACSNRFVGFGGAFMT